MSGIEYSVTVVSFTLIQIESFLLLSIEVNTIHAPKYSAAPTHGYFLVELVIFTTKREEA